MGPSTLLQRSRGQSKNIKRKNQWQGRFWPLSSPSWSMPDFPGYSCTVQIWWQQPHGYLYLSELKLSKILKIQFSVALAQQPRCLATTVPNRFRTCPASPNRFRTYRMAPKDLSTALEPASYLCKSRQLYNFDERDAPTKLKSQTVRQKEHVSNLEWALS